MKTREAIFLRSFGTGITTNWLTLGLLLASLQYAFRSPFEVKNKFQNVRVGTGYLRRVPYIYIYIYTSMCMHMRIYNTIHFAVILH